MEDRRFTEVDLRAMLDARSYRRDLVEGRWIIVSRHSRRTWEVIIEPDVGAKLLVIVTAYPAWDD